MVGLPVLQERVFSRASLLAVGVTLACIAFAGSALAQATIQTWNGQFTDTRNSENYPFVMVGTDPSNPNQNGGYIPVYVVPSKLPLGTRPVRRANMSLTEHGRL